MVKSTLLIVESPAKCGKIEGFLGLGYKCMATYGHLRTLNNLKNIDLKIPKKQLIVITGLSGSGKSSLAFDTIYAEGQRRFIESLSSYTRQFLGKLNKPKVKKIEGLSPAIAIEQKVNNSNPRSTVGTSSEVYDYIKLLYSRIGKTYSPITGKEVVKENVNTVINYINTFDEGDKFLVMTKLVCPKNIYLQQYLKLFLDEGYACLLYTSPSPRDS